VSNFTLERWSNVLVIPFPHRVLVSIWNIWRDFACRIHLRYSSVIFAFQGVSLLCIEHTLLLLHSMGSISFLQTHLIYSWRYLYKSYPPFLNNLACVLSVPGDLLLFSVRFAFCNYSLEGSFISFSSIFGVFVVSYSFYSSSPCSR